MNFRFHDIPAHVGFLVIAPGFKIGIQKKPARFHLWAMRRLFGWQWEDL